MRRTDRYRWTHHGASISEELCERRGRGVAFAVRGPSECRHLGRFHAGPTSGVVGGSVLTHRHLRHRRCHLDGGGGCRRGPGLPPLAGSVVDAAGRAEVWRKPPPGRSGVRSQPSAGGCCNGDPTPRQADELQQLRRCRCRPSCCLRLFRTSGRHHQAREPVRHRRCRERRRGLSQGVCDRPGVGFRGSGRGQSRGLARTRGGDGGRVHRGHHRSGLRAVGTRRAPAEEESPNFANSWPGLR